jgi:hypothetical protein
MKNILLLFIYNRGIQIMSLLKNASLEAIGYKKGKELFYALLPIFDAIRDIEDKENDIKKDYFDSTDISKIVMEYTGLNIKVFVTNGRGYASVGVPKLHSKNVLLGDWYGAEQLDIDGYKLQAELRTHLKGHVNVKEGTVDGIFSKMLSKVYISKRFLNFCDFTSEEHVAVLLHELGHVFTYFEYMIETTTTNQVLKNASERMLKIESPSERVIYLSSLEKDLKIKIPNKEELAKSNKKEVVYTMLMSDEYSRLRSSSGTEVYDIKSWEFLADQFATRHGAGRHLAIANYKLDKLEGGNSTRSVPLIYFMNFLKMGAAGWLASMSLVGALIVFAIFARSSSKSETVHDDPEQRVLRIKQDLIQELKTPDIDKDHRDDILEEIAMADEILNQLNDHRDFLEFFWDTVLPHRRDARKDYELQQRLEELAANPLYVHAAKLQSLS